MSPPDDPAGGFPARLLLAQHLEFLREIGLTGLRLHSPVASESRSAHRMEESAPVTSWSRPGSLEMQAPLPSGAQRGPEPSRREAPGGAAAALETLRAEEIGDCRRCALCEARKTIVFGSGDPGARLMFVGEGPGRDEDIQGLPFVGRAGQLLTDIISAMKLTRGQVYIANVVKCRPPDNRTPLPEEIEACMGFLKRQISIISPGVIVCLGAVAAQALLGTTIGITKLRGEFREYEGIPVMATYHPAYLLRNPAKKREVWEDMKLVMARLAP